MSYIIRRRRCVRRVQRHAAEISVHIKFNIQCFILILMNAHFIYKHSEVHVGYFSFCEYLVKYLTCARKLFLHAAQNIPFISRKDDILPLYNIRGMGKGFAHLFKK